ncbi:acetate--CoA ligase [Methanotrichaceae archaeon M04Ac]|uniref:Acetyl-coenzyme A synthetase n=1 Tax=Candidatus Methanocrinis alkalitolerans TaxID=3033395 RepID=A0ABT5XF87_9EURY|nr:acetate--CoA ligase [Candidatus Methanocrinis alkalitolerans]MDF0593366.1 acetate--CoA ligase [Candidatus Methanocrinis alkalitolerans]
MAEAKTGKTKVFQEETRIFEPPKDLVENSNVMKYMKKKGFKTEKELRGWCSKNYIEFWDEMAKEYIDWFKPYTKVMDDSDMPYFKWFTDGEVNITYNCVDRHAKGAKKDKVAYIWVPEPTDQATQKITYGDLYKEVNKFANGLKSLGLKKGDRASIYMPMIPQLPIAVLACAKIGVIHSVVFSGFSSKGLSDRAADCGSKVIITTDGLFRRGKPIPLKPNVDEALEGAPTVEHVIVFKRAGLDVAWKEGRDVWWDDLVADKSEECEPEKLDPEHRLYILYTSGTTGKPKGIEHAQGGNAVGPAQTLHWVFDLKEDDVWWCTADIGWVTGHSYIVYGPLTLGVTGIMYEGSPDFPDFGRWWGIIQEHKVTKFYTAPTAIRMFMKQGAEWPDKYDLSSLKLLGSVGEPINPEAWMWYREHVGGGKLQIMDTWWQTETGTFICSPLPITPLKPGSCTFPLPGFNTTIYDEEGNEVPLGEGGNIVNETPWPSMLRAFWGDKERFMKEYWQFYWDTPKRGTYLAGDKATRDKDGYFWIQGRIDDVLSVAGHRIANAEVESALVAHPKIAEAAVVGKPDAVKGESIVAFAVLNVGVEQSPELAKDAISFVRKTLGPVAAPSEVYFVNDLPKTRSGKIMRRVVKAKCLGNPTGDISTLLNPEAVDGIPLIV